MKRALVALTLAVSAVAHADPDAARATIVLAHFTAQVKAIGANDFGALEKTLTKDALVTFKGQDPTRAADAEWDFPDPEQASIVKSRVGWAGTWGWVAADVEITTRWYAEPAGAGDPHPQPETHVYHWLSLVVADGAGVKTRALFVDQVTADKDLSSMTRAAPATAGPIATLATHPADLAAKLAADAAVSVFGNGASDEAFGRAASLKLLASWKKLTVAVTGTPIEETSGDLGFAFATLELDHKGQPDPLVLRALVIARKTGDGWNPVAVEYGF